MSISAKSTLKHEITDFTGGLAMEANPGEAETQKNLHLLRNNRLAARPGIKRKTIAISGNIRHGLFYSDILTKFLLAAADGLYVATGDGDTPVEISAPGWAYASRERASFVEYGSTVYLTDLTNGYSKVTAGSPPVHTPLAGASAPPVKCQFLAVRGNLVYAAVGRTLYYCVLDNPESWGASLKLTFAHNIVGMWVLYNDLFLFFDTGLIGKLLGLIKEDFYFMPWGGYKGRYFVDSGILSMNQIFYTTHEGIWLYDGVSHKLLTSKFDEAHDMFPLVASYQGSTIAELWEKNYFVSYSDNGSVPELASRTLVYDILHDHLWEITGRNIMGFATNQGDDTLRFAQEKRLYDYQTANTTDDTETATGQTFSVEWTSGWLDLGAPNQDKRVRAIHTWATMDANSTLTVYYDTAAISDTYTMKSGRTEIEIEAGYKSINQIKLKVTGASQMELRKITVFYDIERP